MDRPTEQEPTLLRYLYHSGEISVDDPTFVVTRVLSTAVSTSTLALPQVVARRESRAPVALSMPPALVS